MSKTVVEREIGGRMMRIETGRVAKLASGAVIISYGETAVLSTCVRATPAPDSISSSSVTIERS